ncbi:MAG: 50S ribosomal protein L5 [Patescibacteria group bacterium]
MNRLEKKYRKEIVPEMKKTLGFANDFEVPRILKVVVNVGIGKLAREEKNQESVKTTLRRITGQEPLLTKAKKSISNFKVRRGMVVGACVTLRRARMYDFLDKLVHATLPRVRDFRGLDTKNLDGHGNLNIGFKEHTVFPEVKSDEIETIHGLEVAIVTNAKTDEVAQALFERLGFPFKKT